MNKTILLILMFLVIPSAFAINTYESTPFKLSYDKSVNNGYYNSTLGVIAYNWGNHVLMGYLMMPVTEFNATNISSNKYKMRSSTFLGIWSNSTTMIIGNITGLT